jgi:hypothetical protein
MTAQSQFPKTHGMNLALGVFLGLTGVALLFNKAARGDLRLLAEIGMSYCGLVSWLLLTARALSARARPLFVKSMLAVNVLLLVLIGIAQLYALYYFISDPGSRLPATVLVCAILTLNVVALLKGARLPRCVEDAQDAGGERVQVGSETPGDERFD